MNDQIGPILEAMRRGDWDTAVTRARGLPASAFPDIVALLEQAEDTRERELCYRILSHVAISSRSPAIGTYAAKRAGIETNAKLIVQALDVAMWTTGITDCRSIVQALGHKNGDVQRRAVQALGACRSQEAEEALLTTLRAAANPGIAFHAAGALARMCGPAAIPELEDVFLHLPRKRANEGTLQYLIFAFARHPNPSSTELVRSELESTRLWGVGWACLNYLFRVGDRSDEDRIVEYLKGLWKRLKRGALVYEYSLLHIDAPFNTELSAARATLLKIATDPGVQHSEDAKT